MRLRVQELVDGMVEARMDAEAAVSGQPGSIPQIVQYVAGLIEGNALRIAGRLTERGQL